jgi:cation diffusion facilitator family transporter
VDGHDHRVLTPTDWGIRAIKWSLGGLAVTALLQLVIVLVSGSVALLADTIHNFSDCLTAIPLWVAFVIGRRPATKRYSYGYERAEDLAGLFIVLVIAASAAFVAWEAVARLMHPRPVDNLPWVIAAGLAGFAGNELVAAYRIREGRRIGSMALVADGHHARTDGLTSLGVVAGGIGAALGFERADPLAGLAIAVVIVYVLWRAGRIVVHRILDGTDESTVVMLESVAAQVAGVEHVTSARARWTGHGLNADLEIQVDPALTVGQGHTIADEVEHELLHALPGLKGATVHVDPHDHGPPRGPVAHHRET